MALSLLSLEAILSPWKAEQACLFYALQSQTARAGFFGLYLFIYLFIIYNSAVAEALIRHVGDPNPISLSDWRTLDSCRSVHGEAIR